MRSTPNQIEKSNGLLNPGRPVSVTWVRKDGTSGSINLNYLVDASGRHGILSTKYLKNRKFNENFKNVANWAYWKSDKVYGPGTHMEGSPYFEALDDCSGWAWFMPLHDSTRSLVTDVKSASDWSYTASAYHLTNARIWGDAGSFIDPLLSSGVHLAVRGGLSAAATIAASIRGDCDEQTAGSWHSKKTVESYTRFLLAVSSAKKQISEQYDPIIQVMDEEGFQRAFDILKPSTNFSSHYSSFTVPVLDLTGCLLASTYFPPEQKDALLEKLKKLGVKSGQTDATAVKALGDIQKHLAVDELQVLETLRSRRMIREDPFKMHSFTLDTWHRTWYVVNWGLLNLSRPILIGLTSIPCDFWMIRFMESVMRGGFVALFGGK
ncbi:FAD/NAD(P)-binding domain-containing protein, partial [Penicillium malachiteum]